jgi:hypothetical protein
MKEVRISDYKLVSPLYFSAPQPMLVLHSTKEFEDYVMNKTKSFILIRNATDLMEFIRERKLVGGSITDTTALNLWVATYEKFIPDVWSRDDIVMWKLNEKNELIPTDNCFVRVYAIDLANTKAVFLYTSSGVYAAGLTAWLVSAAVKPQFTRVSTTNRKQLGGKDHNANLRKFIERKRSSVRDALVIGRMLNERSPYYMNPFDAVKSVFGSKLRKKDIPLYISSQRIAKLFIQELGVIMPTLEKAFLENIPDKDVVKMATDMFNKALEKGTTENQMDVFNLIIGIRNKDEFGNQANGYQLIGDKTHPELAPAQEDRIINYEDTDLNGKADSAVIITDEQANAEKEKVMEALREETGSVSEYVQ